MTYANLLVRREIGRTNAPVLAVAAQLARLSQAAVTGVAACRPMPMGFSSGYTPEAAIEQDRAPIEAAMAEAAEEFRTALAPVAQEVAWRSFIVLRPLSVVITAEARGADLIVTAPRREHPLFDETRFVDVDDLVMTAGRPCLVVPDHAAHLDLGHVVVAWKDTVEARRAVRDAIPILRAARRVTVLELGAPEDMERAGSRVGDVAAWLVRHQVNARGDVDELLDATSQLRACLDDGGAGLIVAGAYGHSRLREWAFGGMTGSLFLGGRHCALMAH